MSRKSFNTYQWNVHNEPALMKTLVKTIEENECVIATITEAKKLVPHLRAWAREEGWYCFAETPLNGDPEVVDERGDTVVLIKKGVGLNPKPSFIMVNRIRWVVSQYNRWHQPRRYWPIEFKKGSLIDGFIGVHFPTDVPRNQDALDESRTRVKSWLLRSGKRLGSGDINLDEQEMNAWIKGWGKFAGAHIDHTFSNGMEVSAKVFPKAGSDHPQVVGKVYYES